MNMNLCRNSDLLLLHAEAEVEIGDLVSAREIVNEIRVSVEIVAQKSVDSPIAAPMDDFSIN